MAGIILDLNDDIKRLQQLKAEIEGVKKALTSINVKVDIDIAEGLEARLQKLMGQYDALVGKIAASEAKVKEAESRMNSATQRITEAQERIAQSAGGQGGASAGSATAGVQAQARAYEELERQIDRVLGTRDENVKLMVREQNAIRMINALIKEVKKSETGSDGVVSQRGVRLLEKYNNDLLTHKAALSQVRQELLNQAKLNNAAGTSMNALSQSLGRMRVAYRELTEEERRSPFGQELLASIQQADAKIKQLDATIGNHQRNVGNYASGWNGLNMSIQQIGRELPSLAMGWNTFFLAISNNLPILSDEISRARKEYEMLKKSGQSATPVWKQVASSLLSWQTALTVGITLLTLYGGEIVEWAKGLFSAGKAVNALTGEVDKFNAAQVESRKSAGAEIGQLRTLRAQAEDVSLAMETRLAAVEKLQQKYPAYLGNLSKEEILAGNASAAYRQLTKDIMTAARARAAQERINELAGRQIQEQRGANADRNFLQRNRALVEEARAAKAENERLLRERFGDNTSSPAARAFAVESYSRYREQYGNILEEYDIRVGRLERHTKNVQELEKQMQSYTGYINQAADAMAMLEENGEAATAAITGKATRDANAVTAAQAKVDELTGKQARERAEREAEIEAEVAQARIVALADGAEKARRQRELDNKKELDAIERQKQAYIEKETQAQREIFEAEEDLKAKRDPKYRKRAFDASSVSVDTSAFDELSALTQKRQAGDAIKAQEAAWREYLLKYGDYQQRRQAIAEKYSEAIDASGTAGEAAMLQKEMQEELDALDEEMRGSATLMGQLFADASEKSVGEIQKIIDKAEQLMAYLGAEKDAEGTATIDGEKVTRGDILALGISENTLENLERSPEEVEALRKGIARLKGELGSRSPFKRLEEDIKAASAAIKSGDVAEGVAKIGSAVSAFAPALSEFGQSLGTIFGSDALGAKIAGVSEAMGGLGQTAAGVGQIMSGDVVGGAMAAVNGIASVVGALDGLFGADYSEYYALKEQYDQLSEIWDELIAKKKEYIDIDYGAEAQKAGAEALELLREQDEYARRLAQSAADAGSSIGSHSIAYRQNRDLGGYLGELRTYMGADNQGEALTQTLIAASAEELREVREGMYQMWMGLDGDFRSALEERIAVLEEQEEVLESMKGAITGTTFDTFYDSYVDMLADMDTDNQDLADNFEAYLRKSILSSLVADKYKEKIRGLYDTWTELGKDGISKGDAELLQQMQQELSESMLADRESLAETFGWDGGSSQSGSQGTFQTMSQEQADELSGRFTAVYEGELRIEQGVVAQTQAITEIQGTIADLSVQSARMYSIADETRSILANSYLELREINENTGAIIKPIKQIQADMAAVKQNTSRI